MACQNCTLIKGPIKSATWAVASITSFNTAVTVYVERSGDSRTESQAITSGAAGQIIIDTSGNFFGENHTYRIYVTLTAATSTEDRETMTDTLDSLEDTCFEFKVLESC